jgi:hypothetical protein
LPMVDVNMEVNQAINTNAGFYACGKFSVAAVSR